MVKNRVRTWIELSKLFDKAQRTFEKKSGWKSKDVRMTLDNFSRLNRMNQVFFGGLLMGQALRKPTRSVRGGRTRSQNRREVTPTASV